MTFGSSFLKHQNLSIDIEDLKCIQKYFIEEKRNPTETEIKALDTYWSDHCRHTTFLTHLENISIEGDYKNEMWTVGAYHPLTKHLNLVAEYSDVKTVVNTTTTSTNGKAKTVSLGAILFF